MRYASAPLAPALALPPTLTSLATTDLAFCHSVPQDARLDILTIHSRRMNLTRGINLRKIAAQMHDASGAETKAICTESGMFALRERRVHVTQDDFEMAVAKVMKKDSEKNMSLKKLWK